MAGISNVRNLILTDVPRVLFTGTKRIAVVADTTSFSSTAGVPTPSAITLTATLFGVSGTINWTVPYGTATLSSSTGASVTLAFGDMGSKVVTVRASVTVVGVTYTSDITLTKTEDGVSGADSKYVIVNPTGFVFTRDDEYSTFAPSAINLSYTAFGGTVLDSVWEYWTGSSWSYISGTSNINVSQAEAFTNSRTYRIRLDIDGVSVTDQVTLTKLTGGTDALSGYLTNESITFATDSLGTTPPNIATLTAGAFNVYYGTQPITGGCTFTKTDVNCTVAIANGTGVYSASAVTADSATSTITATHTATGLQVTKVLSLSKSRIGGTGASGNSSFTATVYYRGTNPAPTATAATGSYNFSTGVIVPPTGNVTWTATKPETTTDPTWACSFTFVGTTASGTITAGTWSVPKIDAQLGLTGAATDIVFLRSNLQPATPTSLANPPTTPVLWYSNVNSVPVTADPMWSSVGKLPAGSVEWTWQVPIKIEGTDGTTPNVVTEVTVYAQAFSAPLTPSGGEYSYASNSFISLPTGADIPTISWVPSRPVAGALPIYQSTAIVSAPAGGSDNSLTWSAPVKIYENADDGIDAKLMSASVSSQVFQINKAGVATPATITLKAIRNNITGATWSVVPLSGTATLTNSTNTGVYESGDVALLKYADMDTDSVTFKVVDASTAYEDTITIVKVREGSDALVGYLTNENVTLPAQTDGTVVSYTGASGNFIVMLGAADVTAYCNFAVEENTSSLTPVNNIVTSGTNTGQYAVTGGFTTDTAEIVYKATYSFLGNLYTVYKKFTLSKSKTGTTGDVGSAGSSARIAYVKTTGTLSPTPSTYTWTGDVLPQLSGGGSPVGQWGEVNAWLTYPPSITVGEQVWQSTGVYNYLTNETTWVSPYLSNLKVGSLAAITVNTGTLTVDASGYVRGGQTGYNTGTGFWLGYDGSAYKFSIGNSTQSLTWNGSVLTLKGNLQVNDAALSGTTMTGSGAQFNAAGTFALGTAANNITYNGTDLTVNGTLSITSQIVIRSSASKYVFVGGSGIGLHSVDTDAGSKSILGTASGSGSVGVFGLGNGANTTGVSGESNTGTGVFGYTLSGRALSALSGSTGYALYANGRVGLIGATSPLELNTAQGTTGQTLISQGTGNTPAWGKKMFSGAQAADGSGNLTVTVDFPDTSYAPVANSTSGVYVVITAKSTTSITFQAQDRVTGLGVSGAGISWIAMG